MINNEYVNVFDRFENESPEFQKALIKSVRQEIIDWHRTLTFLEKMSTKKDETIDIRVRDLMKAMSEAIQANN